MEQKLSSDFLNELLQACLKSKTILEICQAHLKWHYIPDESLKKVFKETITHFELNNSLPSFGVLSQIFDKDKVVKEQLVKIKNAKVQNSDDLLSQLEKYIKQSMFVELYDKIGTLYNDGKSDEAYKLLQDKSEEITKFSLVAKSYEAVFGGFQKRNRERILKFNDASGLRVKIPFNIDALNVSSHGGTNRGDTYMYVARSAVGKSKALKSDGVAAARIGCRVVHFQLEGSKQECMDAYDACWSGSKLDAIESGDIKKETLEKLYKVVNDIDKLKGEIYIVAYEKFNTATTANIRQSIIDIEKEHGKVDLVLVDYFEKSNPIGIRINRSTTEGEKAFRQALGEQYKNIAVELDLVIGTATQASDVKPELYNSNKFVLTRSNIKGDKNQIDPFSYVFTFNQTSDERKEKIMRIFEDKIRKYVGGKVHSIYTSYETERFYDRKRTLSIQEK